MVDYCDSCCAAGSQFSSILEASCRILDAKRRLYQAIVANLENCSAAIARDHVLISLREEPFEHWGIRGGQAASDVDVGYSTLIQ
ncbi:MAG: hypothetical protein EAZ37_03450 [Burkholderiales bacterium]|nr:MAG: hypothetical protein EAZ37_03450 [Burkholderiales bacterium]